jgi:hypothetical protein
MNELIPRDGASGGKLAKWATNAIFGIGGGIALFTASFLLKWLVQPAGLVIGGVLALLGISGIFSRDASDRKDGFFVLLTGAVLFGAFWGIGPIKNIASWLLSTGGLISFALGLWNGLRFLFGMRKRR